jgi:hypothetical protein
MSLACSLTYFSLPLTCSIIIVVTWICIINVWICKGMISKHVPPLNGLTNLIVATCYTINGVDGALLLVLISTYTKLRGLYLKSRKIIQYACSSSW